jgi:hypothetical protein
MPAVPAAVALIVGGSLIVARVAPRGAAASLLFRALEARQHHPKGH